MKTIFDIVEYSPWIKGLMTPMLGVDGTRLRASASGLGAQHERLPGQAWLVAGGARPERGVDRTYVSQIERAVGNPSLLVLCKLGAILETDVLDLLAEQTK